MRFFERYFMVVGATERNSQSRASDALVHQCIAFGMYPVSVRAGYGSCGSRSREGGSDSAACSGRGSARRSRFNHAEDVQGLHGWSSELPASALAGKAQDSRQAALAHTVSDRRRNRSQMGHGWQSGLLEGPLGESDPTPSETSARASRCARVSV